MQGAVWSLGVAALLAVVQFSCGTDPLFPDDDGADIVSYGSIGRLDGVTVNGTRFDTSGAEILIGGERASHADLQIGMVVRLTGNEDDDAVTASRVEYDRTLAGPITSIDRVNRRFVVLGRTVAVLPDTGIDGGEFDSLAVDDRVEVSGLIDADDVVRARYIAKRERIPFELEGRIGNLDAFNSTLYIGAQAVDYSTATLRGFSAGGPTTGQWVDVRGPSLINGVLRASVVELKDGTLAASGRRVELKGIVGAVDAGGSFLVGSQWVRTDSATRWLPSGTGFLNLETNIRARVEGRVETGGVVRASRVELEPLADSEVLAQLDAIDADAGTVTALGRRLTVTDRTLLEDRSASAARPFDFADLRSGDWVRVGGYVDAQDRFIAVRLERRDAPAALRLEGSASDIAQPELRVAGVRVQTHGGTVFRDLAGNRVSQSQFFSQLTLAPGLGVRISGERLGNTVRAREAWLRGTL